MKKKNLFFSILSLSLIGVLTLTSCDLFNKEEETLSPVPTITPTETVEPIKTDQHVWSKPTYQWSSNNKYVVAKRTCSHCDKIENEKVSTEEDITVVATCTQAGEVTYITEPFENPVFEIQMKTVSTPAHHTEVIDARVEPTYTSTGLTAGSHCSVCGEIITAQIVIPKLVNPFYEEYEWSADNSTVTANQYTTVANALVKTETKPVTREVTTNGNCIVKDTVTLTADFDDADFETQTKTVEGDYRHTPYVSKEARAATCLTDGNTEEISCSVCKQVLTASETLKAEGHLETVVPAQAPAGYVAGLSEYKKCSKCNTWLTKPTIVEPSESIIDTSNFNVDVNITNTFNIPTERLYNLTSSYAQNIKFFLAKNESDEYDLFVKFPAGYVTSANEGSYNEIASLNQTVKTSADNDISGGDYVTFENHSIISRNKMFKVTFSTNGVVKGTPKEYGYEERYNTSGYDKLFKIYSGSSSSPTIAQYFENIQIDLTMEIEKYTDGDYSDSSTHYYTVTLKYSTD